MSTGNIRVQIIIAAQVALLGMIKPNMRGITCGWNSDAVTIRFIFDGICTAEDKYHCEEVASELAARFSSQMVHCQITSVPWPDSIRDQMLEAWVYMRWEDNADN